MSAPPVRLPSGVWRFDAVVAGSTLHPLGWVDGDTLDVVLLIDTGHAEQLTRRRRLRLVGIDTPELTSPDPAVRDRARAAKAAAEALAPAGSTITVDVVGYDKYGGRDDAIVYLGHVDADRPAPESLASELIAGGYGVPYDGGTR